MAAMARRAVSIDTIGGCLGRGAKPGLARGTPPPITPHTSVGLSAAGDARIKVVGCGGGGGNAVNRMISSGLSVSGQQAVAAAAAQRALLALGAGCCSPAWLGRVAWIQFALFGPNCAGRGVLGGQHRCAGAGEPPGAQQAADWRAAHPRPGCVPRRWGVGPQFGNANLMFSCSLQTGCPAPSPDVCCRAGLMRSSGARCPRRPATKRPHTTVQCIALLSQALPHAPLPGPPLQVVRHRRQA